MFSNALQQYINFKSDIKGKINYFKQFQVKNVLIILQERDDFEDLKLIIEEMEKNNKFLSKGIMKLKKLFQSEPKTLDISFNKYKTDFK